MPAEPEPRGGAAGRAARPARAGAGRRAGAPARRLGPLAARVRPFEPLLDFYYRYWFRVETEGIEHVPAEGGALIVSNHSGALPPDAPMIMQAIRHEHPSPRPAAHARRALVQGLSRASACWPTRSGWWPPTRPTPSGCCTTRAGWCSSSPRARRARASSTGSATGCAASGAAASCAPRCAPACRSCPSPCWAPRRRCRSSPTCPLLQRLTGLIYFPVNHAFPQFGLAAALMYLPAKFKIRFLEPVDLSGYTARGRRGPGAGAGDRRAASARASSSSWTTLRSSRRSVWFG